MSNNGSPPLSIGTRNGIWEIAQHWEGGAQPFVRPLPYATDRWTDFVVHAR